MISLVLHPLNNNYWDSFFFRATPTAYGSSQARGKNRTAAASLNYSHSNQIWAMSATYTTAHGNVKSLTHWTGPGIEPASSWKLDLFPPSHDGNSRICFYWRLPESQIHTLTSREWNPGEVKELWLGYKCSARSLGFCSVPPSPEKPLGQRQYCMGLMAQPFRRVSAVLWCLAIWVTSENPQPLPNSLPLSISSFLSFFLFIYLFIYF